MQRPAQVRESLKRWLQSDEVKAETNDAMSPRYNYCERVDADAINSGINGNLQPPRHAFDEHGHATLVKMYPEEFDDTEDGEDSDEDKWWLMDSVKVPISYLGVELYGSLHEDTARGCDRTWDELRRFRTDDGVSCGVTLEILWDVSFGYLPINAYS